MFRVCRISTLSHKYFICWEFENKTNTIKHTATGQCRRWKGLTPRNLKTANCVYQKYPHLPRRQPHLAHKKNDIVSKCWHREKWLLKHKWFFYGTIFSQIINLSDHSPPPSHPTIFSSLIYTSKGRSAFKLFNLIQSNLVDK